MRRVIFATMLALSSTSVRADVTCRDLFKTAIHTLPAAEVDRLANQVELYSDRLHSLASHLQHTNQPFRVDLREVDLLLRASAQLLQSQGAQVRATRVGGFPALEIVPNATLGPGWNKMAASVKSRLNARLVFAPVSLTKFGASAMMAEGSTSGRQILISRQSLSVGRRDYRNGEEFGHVASRVREATDPNSFMGAIDSLDPQAKTPLAPGTRSHHEQMSNDEIVRSSKNFVRIARSLEQGSPRARRELREIADNANDVVKVTRVSIESLETVTKSIIEGADVTGVSMAYNGTPKENSAFVDSEGGQILIEPLGPQSVRLDFEGLDVNVEIIARDRDGSLQRLIPGLQAEDPASLRRFQSLIPGIVGEWIRDQKVAIAGIEKSIDAVERMETMDDAALAREVRASAEVIAPLIARRRP